MNKVTVSQSISIRSPIESVWDYTQDWTRRKEWDRSVVEAHIVSDSPRVVRVKAQGGLNFEVIYKLYDRPRMTTLSMNNLNSFWLKGGGGSWKYESKSQETFWTQHNTLTLRNDFLGTLMKPIFSFILSLTTKQIMSRAKNILERGS